MGNCIERCRSSLRRDEEIMKPHEVKSDEKESSKMRIRVVLTKDELEWLMVELKRRQGTRIEDVLVEIQRNREKSAAWKPCLESIVESPEVPEVMGR